MVPAWRVKKADDLFPDQEKWARSADTPYLFLIELRLLFEKAYVHPRDESFIKRVYDYADWCDHQPRGKTAEDDLLSAAAVCFYEHLPENQAVRADMPRWFTRQEILNMKSLLRYRISERSTRKVSCISFPLSRPEALKHLKGKPAILRPQLLANIQHHPSLFGHFSPVRSIHLPTSASPTVTEI